MSGPSQEAFRTQLGVSYRGFAEEILSKEPGFRGRRKASLILTSPPFPLNRKKEYGNQRGQEYVDWLKSFAPVFRSVLRPDGSIVIEMGNSWEPGRPVMSTLALRALLSFQDEGQLNLCQQFVWYNNAKLPTPAQWVTVERIRVKDAFTHIWWLSPSDRPKANNRRVLTEYSKSMKQLLARGRYNSGPRPSEHRIGPRSFLKDNKGAIPSNVISSSNTSSNTDYLKYCRSRGLKPHPARMPLDVAEFFIKLLTVPGDIVLDPFAGSNTTGAAAERLGRRWVAIEPLAEYVEGSRGRFLPLLMSSSDTA